MAPRILIVEDDPPVAGFLAEVLAGAGYDIAVAYDGPQALEQLRFDPPALMLLDIMLPSMGGWELARLVRAERAFQHLPIIVCTGTARPMPTGSLVQGLLSKPFDPAEILRLVAAVLDAS